MTSDNSGNVLQNEAVVDFIVAATRYCGLVETDSTPEWTRDTMQECRIVLSKLYYSTLEMPPFHQSVRYDSGFDMERIVTEEAYEKIRRRLARFFGIEDYFLNAQQEEQKYSDRPVSASVSELMTDLYQTLADPVWNIRRIGPEVIPDILSSLRYNFDYDWGQSLLLILKQLHDLTANPDFEPSPATDLPEGDDLFDYGEE